MGTVTVEQSVEMSGIHIAIHERLRKVRRRENIARIIYGAAFSAFILAGALLTVLVGEDLLHMTVGLRTAVFWSFLLLIFLLFIWRIGPPLGRLTGIMNGDDDLDTARKIGRAFPELNDRLFNAMQLLCEKDTARFYSADLMHANIEDVYLDCDGFDFSYMVDFSNSRLMARLLAVTAASGILLFILFPTAFFGAANRLLHYDEAFVPSPPFRFVVDPGNKEVVKADNVPVRVRVEGDSPRQITIAYRREGQLEFDETKMAQGGDGLFRYEFDELKETMHYHLQARGIRGDEYVLTVIDRPLIRLLRVMVEPPAYSGMPEMRLDDNIGDVTALRGATIHFEIEANMELQRANIVCGDSTVMSLSVSGKRASGRIVVMKEMTYHIELRDTTGTASSNPVEYTIKLIPDGFPTVTLLMPGTDIDVTHNSSVELMVKITDDFGFSKLRLAYKLVQSKYEKPSADFSYIPLQLPIGRFSDTLIPYSWNLGKLHLVPGDVVSYRAEVFDNDIISGPKMGVSGLSSFRLPSLDEIFAETDKRHQTSIEAMQESLNEAQEARKELEELNNSLNAGRDKMEWRDQQKADELLKKYDDARARMDEVKKTVDQLAANLQKNQVLSKETLEKYQELQQTIEQMSSPEFAEVMKKLQQAMQLMNPEALKQAMEQFNMAEDNFRKSIERTLNLLKRIQIEQKVDEAVRRAQELVTDQTELQKITQHTTHDDQKTLDELRQEQQKVKKQVTALQNAMNNLQEKMEEFPGEMPLSEMKKAENELRQGRLEQEMDSIAIQLQQMQPEQASVVQQQALGAMSSTVRQLQKMQQVMHQNQQRQIVNEMRGAMEDFLELSRREEELKNETESLEPDSHRFRDNAEAQMDVIHELGMVTERLAALSQKTFGVTPEMGKAIGNALRSMDNAMQSLDQRNRNGGVQQQGEAMGSLNEAAHEVADAMNGIMQGGGQGVGMAGFMQRLERMSTQQQGINSGTGNIGGMTSEQAATMARLAAEQGMVRKSLEQLAREATASGDLNKMLGDLAQVAWEMKEVETDLAAGNIKPETRRKEERILSRLLDAQRSARERDYERRRTSAAGQNVTRPSPGQIDASTMEGKDRLRRDMQKALEEGYSREYEEMIKRYFEILEQIEPRSK